MSSANDSTDLEALFDSIAADYSSAPSSIELFEQNLPPAVAKQAPPPVTVAPAPLSNGADNDDLQALFDSISSSFDKPAGDTSSQVTSRSASVDTPPSLNSEADQQERVFNKIGHMARALHDTLSQLGYDKLLEKTVTAIPDAKDRLAYVANLTEQAACKVLNATDVAGPVVDSIAQRSNHLAAQWDLVFANKMTTAQFKQLAEQSRDFFKSGLPGDTKQIQNQLTEIMMAQDFQDLTGQVIKKIVSLAQELESGLMNVLLDVVPDEKKTEEVTSLMNGPVINTEGRSDVVVNQEQVDDLLDSLGF